MHYFDVFRNAYTGYFNYVWQEVTFQSSPWWKNYFFWLLLLSAFFFALELARPWRANQPKIRKDFWLDFFYMFFNFFLFSLLIYNAVSSVLVEVVNHIILTLTSIDIQKLNPMQNLPFWAILLIGFVVRDFVQWNVHRMLHYFPSLWGFHKVHHSVEQMGFAAHLRYHWVETLVYRTCEYLPLALLGIGLHEFFIIHIFTVAVGHYNHSNFYLPPTAKGSIFGALIGLFVGGVAMQVADIDLLIYVFAGAAVGVLLRPIWGYVFNSPEMHIWHHAQDLPDDRQTGVNFGITLAIWDYIFGSNYIPHNGRDIPLGFDDVDKFPKNFIDQATTGFQNPRA
jgi:sterol desaturase/sphingolipid hydroxylase (fatty acid hydroxylase superfamily)